LTGVIEESSKNNHAVENTLDLLRTVELPMYITTPIIFSEDYSELVDPVGILKTITEVGAFKKGATGSETIPELEEFKEKITEIPGKQGLNAFVNTDLEATLRQNSLTLIWKLHCAKMTSNMWYWPAQLRLSVSIQQAEQLLKWDSGLRFCPTVFPGGLFLSKSSTAKTYIHFMAG